MGIKDNRYAHSAAITADGDYPDSSGWLIGGGRYEFINAGTPDGATVAVHVKPAAGAAFYAVEGAEYANTVTDTNNAPIPIEFAVGDTAKFVVTNDGASTSITPQLIRLEH